MDENFQSLQRLAKEIAERTAPRQPDLFRDSVEAGERGPVSIEESILIEWATSGEFKAQRAFLEIARGKTPPAPRQLEIKLDEDGLSDEELDRRIAALARKVGIGALADGEGAAG